MNLQKSVKVLNAIHGKTSIELAESLGITRVWLWHKLKENNTAYIEKCAAFYGVTVADFINKGK